MWSPSTIKYVNLLPVRFADDTTMLGQVTGGDEFAYKEEVQKLTECCTANNLFLNTKKTKELIVDLRRNQNSHLLLNINGEEVERL